MMKTLNIKRRLLLICVLCFGLFVSAIIGLNLPVHADGEMVVGDDLTTGEMKILNAVQIKNNNPLAIRFITQVEEDFFDALYEDTTRYGTLINTYSNYSSDSSVLTLGDLNTKKTVEIRAKRWQYEDGWFQFKALLTGKEGEDAYGDLPPEMYGKTLVARSYVIYYDWENNRQVVRYTPVVQKSMCDVAKSAVAEEEWGSSTAELLLDITSSVAHESANRLSTVDANLTSGAADTSVSVPVAYGAVQKVYQKTSTKSGYKYTEYVNETDYTYDSNTLTLINAQKLGKYSYIEDTRLTVLADNGVFEVPLDTYYNVSRTLGFDTDSSYKWNSNCDTKLSKLWYAKVNHDVTGSRGLYQVSISTDANIKSDIQCNFATKLSSIDLNKIDWDYLEMRVYVGYSGSSIITAKTSYSSKSTACDVIGTLEPNAWNILRIKKTDIVAGLSSRSAYLFKYIFSQANNSTYGYFNALTIDKSVIDSGKLILEFDYIDLKEGECDTTFNFEDKNNTEVYGYDGTYGATWTESYAGAHGLWKCRYAVDNYFKFKLKTTTDALSELDWDYVEFRVYAELNDERDSWDYTDSARNPAGWTRYIEEGTNWRVFRANKEKIRTAFGSLGAFYKAITDGSVGMCYVWNIQLHGDLYFDYFRFGKTDNTMNFENPNENEFLKSGSNVKWLESATDHLGNTENGVISYYHGTTAYAGIKFKFNNYTHMDVSDWDVIKVRIRVIRGSSAGEPGTDAYFNDVVVCGTSYYSGEVGKIGNGGPYGYWSTLTIKKEHIISPVSSATYTNPYVGNINAFWTAFTSDAGAQIFLLNDVWYSSDWTIQISSISLEKNDNFDRVMDFESSDEISYLKSGQNEEHLTSAMDDKSVTEYGVLSFEHGTEEGTGFALQFNNTTGMTVDDWDKIQIRIRIIRGSSAGSDPKTGNGTDASASLIWLCGSSIDNGALGSIDNAWSTLTITKDQIKATTKYYNNIGSFWTDFTSSDGTKLIHFDTWINASPGDWKIQIDYVALIKNY